MLETVAMAAPKRLSNDEIDRIDARLRGGENLTEIAADMGMARVTLERRLFVSGRPPVIERRLGYLVPATESTDERSERKEEVLT